MITCQKKHLEQRAADRGYTWEQVEPCIVKVFGSQIVVDETHQAYPRAKMGLGDMVELGLSAVGITKERVSKAIGRPCGCGKRQQKLNELGKKILGIGD